MREEDIELGIQLKLKDFLEELGVKNPLDKWIDIERFVEEKITPAYADVDEDTEDFYLEDQLEKENAIFAFENLQETAQGHLSYTKEKIGKITKKLETLQRESLAEVNSDEDLKKILDELRDLYVDVESYRKEVSDWYID